MCSQQNDKLTNNTMGSSRSRFPAPIPYGYGSYEQGTDSSGTGAVMPKGQMPEGYTPQTQQPWAGGTNGLKYGESAQGTKSSAISAFSQGSNYSPFFMRF